MRERVSRVPRIGTYGKEWNESRCGVVKESRADDSMTVVSKIEG